MAVIVLYAKRPRRRHTRRWKARERVVMAASSASPGPDTLTIRWQADGTWSIAP